MKLAESQIEGAVKLESPVLVQLLQGTRKAKWAGARMLFIGCTAFGVTTGVGLYLLAPLFSYWFFGSLRFWKYAGMGPRMIGYAYRMAYCFLKGEFAPALPLTAPPMSKPDLKIVQINPAWQNGDSCADCGKCCIRIGCPLREKENGHCMGYDAFYWRYFNCGRYPTNQKEIDWYECPKWIMKPHGRRSDS
jgi:hypothetical protein